MGNPLILQILFLSGAIQSGIRDMPETDESPFDVGIDLAKGA